MSSLQNSQNSKEPTRISLDKKDILSVISDLGSKNKAICQIAYQSLIEIGEFVVPDLVTALTDSNQKIRWEASKLLEELKVDWTPYVNDKTIESLINDLASQNGFERIRVRRALVNIGTRSVKPLIQAFSSKEEMKRWESAKALSQIGDSSTTVALIKALTDENFDIRWLAAEGLISIGEPALIPLLQELIRNPESEWLREGAHHYLHEINNEHLNAAIRPVLKALQSDEAHLEVPLAAESAINTLTSK
jgi:HEAT repeat protein